MTFLTLFDGFRHRDSLFSSVHVESHVLSVRLVNDSVTDRVPNFNLRRKQGIKVFVCPTPTQFPGPNVCNTLYTCTFPGRDFCIHSALHKMLAMKPSIKCSPIPDSLSEIRLLCSAFLTRTINTNVETPLQSGLCIGD